MNVIAKYLAGAALAAGSYVYYQGDDARYIKKALNDVPTWKIAHANQCQASLAGTAEECQCLVDKSIAWNTDRDKPPAGTRIWDHAYMKSIFYSDDWNEGVLHTAIEQEIVKEVGEQNIESQKAYDIYDRYFDEVIQAVTFSCFKGDKAYTFWDSDQTWESVVEITYYANIVGQELVLSQASN